MNNEKYLDSDNNNENSNDINNDNNVIIDEKIDVIINENINGNDGVNDSVNGSRNDCVNDSGIIDDGIEKQEFAAELMDMIRDIAGSDHVIEVSVPDPAVVLRAGTSSGCEKVKDHLFSLRTPGLSYCRELLQWVNMSKGRLRHSEKVAFYAREMAEEFNSRGRDTYSLLLDENITAAGGMLHDIAKGCPGHAAVGAAMLRSLNMARAAEIVENHQLPAERYFRSTSPVLIVYLADKMFLGDKLVGIEERFRRKREKHEGDERAQKKLAYKEKQALRAKKVYENSILGWPVG
jgi:HD superfamily phosphohydrolase YqeK